MHNLSMSEQHLRVIDAALQDLPYKIAAPVIFEIARQMNEATTPQPTAKKPKK